MSHSHDTARLAESFYDADTRRKAGDAPLSDDDLVLLGTVTEDPAVVRHRDRLEKAHLRRVVDFGPTTRVLDLGGGAGRLALWLAPHVAHVTLVDASEALLHVADREAGRRGLGDRVRTVHASVLDFAPDERFDVVLVFGVAAYLTDDEVERLVEVCAAAVKPGGVVALKEPVSGDEQARWDERRDAAGAVQYRMQFRPADAYPAFFQRRLRSVYQRSTVAHPIPFFLGGTEGAVKATRGGLTQRAFERLSPALARLDPALQDAEDALRGHPLTARLLARLDTLQHLYVFAAPPAVPAATGEPDLSVVVIAYNEEDCLRPVTDELAEKLVAAGVDYEIVFVDDGSADRTLEIMRGLADAMPRIQVNTQPNKGIGGALRTGFDAAKGRYVTWVPADGQIAPETVIELFRRRHEATMLTTVYRHRDDPWYRMVISNTLNTLIKLKTGEVAKSGGNYLFDRRAWLEHGPRDDDSMMISTAFRQNLRDAGDAPLEVEIDARARVAGHSKVLNPRAIGRTFLQLLKMGR
ncbi:MAG: glycosyltransferase [Myxococcales bacterium]|nr:glycosyltransferase [Myxococcales bacterium]